MSAALDALTTPFALDEGFVELVEGRGHPWREGMITSSASAQRAEKVCARVGGHRSMRQPKEPCEKQNTAHPASGLWHGYPFSWYVNRHMNDVLTVTLQAVKIKVLTEGPVFRTPQGGPHRNFRTAFERAVQQAGLEDFTFHDLRHTFASRLVMAGVDLPTVKELLGHKGIAMTLRYTHLSSDHKQRAVNALEQFGSKVPTNFPTWREHRTGSFS